MGAGVLDTPLMGQTNVLCNSYTSSGGQDVALETSLQESHCIPLFFFKTTDLPKHSFSNFKLKCRNISCSRPHKTSIMANEENVLF